MKAKDSSVNGKYLKFFVKKKKRKNNLLNFLSVVERRQGQDRRGFDLSLI